MQTFRETRLRQICVAVDLSVILLGSFLFASKDFTRQQLFPIREIL
jgi:hypothetical protein